MMDNFAGQLVSTLIALAIVGVLAWFSIALLKRIQEGRARQPGVPFDALPRFVRALPVGPKERVVVIHYHGEELLLGVTSGGIQLLTRHPLAGVSQVTSAAGDAPGATTPGGGSTGR